MSALVAAIVTASAAQTFLPSQWAEAKLYVWYLLGTVPQLAVQAWLVVTATLLLRGRDANNLAKIRKVTAVYAAVTTLTLGIDIAFFSEPATLMLDGLAMCFACLWAVYFRCSSRVLAVFVGHNWTYKPPAPPTGAHLRYLQRRAAVWGGVTFVGLLLLMGYNWDSAPEFALFAVPIGYSLVAACIGRYAPVNKAKLAKLTALAQECATGSTGSNASPVN